MAAQDNQLLDFILFNEEVNLGNVKLKSNAPSYPQNTHKVLDRSDYETYADLDFAALDAAGFTTGSVPPKIQITNVAILQSTFYSTATSQQWTFASDPYFSHNVIYDVIIDGSTNTITLRTTNIMTLTGTGPSGTFWCRTWISYDGGSSYGGYIADSYNYSNYSGTKILSVTRPLEDAFYKIDYFGKDLIVEVKSTGEIISAIGTDPSINPVTVTNTQQ